MAFSVNTNAGAFIALQNLNATTSALNTTQNRVNTGLKVSSAKDDAATFAIAQKLRADVAGLNAVKGSLDRATQTLDVGIAAGEAVADLLTTMKEKAVSAKDPGLDDSSRAKLDTEFQQLKSQITSIVSNAKFNGKNIVDGSDTLVAITDSEASSTKNISLAAQDLTLTTLNLDDISLNAADDASTAASAIAAAIDTVNTTLSDLGATSKRIDLQRTFVNKLSDTIETGIGNLVDADLAKESARLQSLQVKQQLGLQALSIANQAPGAVVSLFR